MVDLNFDSTYINSDFNFDGIEEILFSFENPFTTFEPVYDFDFNFSTSTFNVLKGVNNIFNSIWCDPDASLLKGRFYVGRAEDLTIINHSDGQAYLEDYYSKTISGRAEETLTDDNISDINITF